VIGMDSNGTPSPIKVIATLNALRGPGRYCPEPAFFQEKCTQLVFRPPSFSDYPVASGGE